MRAIRMTVASTRYEGSMMRRGIKPNGASPARRASERLSAGPIELRNSLQREDQSTVSLGESCVSTTLTSSCAVWLIRTGGGPRERLFQFYRRLRFLFRPRYGTEVPEQKRLRGGRGQSARDERQVEYR